MKPPVHNRRSGLTLLEVTIAAAMMATLVTSVSVVVRTVYTTWLAKEDDLARLEAAHAVVRHIVRHARQATAVAALTDPSETAGSLSLSMPSGDTYVWARDDATGEVKFGIAAASDLLAENITSLTLTGYQADGTTATTVASEVQTITCAASVQLTAGGGTTRTVTCRAWLRSW